MLCLHVVAHTRHMYKLSTCFKFMITVMFEALPPV